MHVKELCFNFLANQGTSWPSSLQGGRCNSHSAVFFAQLVPQNLLLWETVTVANALNSVAESPE